MRFTERLERSRRAPDECWPWYGGVDGAGYGVCSTVIRGRRYTHAHAAAFAFLVGDMQEGLELDHKCDNRWCVNPACMEQVTHQENLARRKRVGRFRIAGGPDDPQERAKWHSEKYKERTPDWRARATAAQKRYEENRRTT